LSRLSSSSPSQRQHRVAELVRQALSDILLRGDVHDEALQAHSVTIPEVRMSPDLKLASAYVMPLGGRDEEMVLKALRRHTAFLRREVARRVNLKFAPNLRFFLDTTFDEAQRIDALLRSQVIQGEADQNGE
jgi:ribosome-binding factor A